MKNFIWALLLVLIAFDVSAAPVSNLPLDQAARNGEVGKVRKLLDAGADPNAENQWGSTALTGASTLRAETPNHTEIVRLLLAHGAHVNKQIQGGSTALNEASYWGNEETVKVLIAAGADPNIAKENGYTALMSASCNGDTSIVKQLISSGANLDAQNKHGLTALHFASGAGHEGVVAVLKEAGANQSLTTVNGEDFEEVAGRAQKLQAALNSIADDSVENPPMSPLGTMSAKEIWLSFAITWLVVLVPPILIRAAVRRPLSSGMAGSFAGIQYFANVVLFTSLGSTSKSHGALLLGAFFVYRILKWQTDASSKAAVARKPKELGYDD